MILLTIGTYPLPFDRLVEAVDRAVGQGQIDDTVFAQIGYSDYRPKHVEFVDILPKEEFDRLFRSASRIVGQAGIGTITMALDHRLPLLVMPRLKQYGEHVNDHQLATARKFEELGHVIAAYDAGDLVPQLHRLGHFTPEERVAHPEAVAERIGRFLAYLRQKSHQ